MTSHLYIVVAFTLILASATAFSDTASSDVSCPFSSVAPRFDSVTMTYHGGTLSAVVNLYFNPCKAKHYNNTNCSNSVEPYYAGQFGFPAREDQCFIGLTSMVGPWGRAPIKGPRTLITVFESPGLSSMLTAYVTCAPEHEFTSGYFERDSAIGGGYLYSIYYKSRYACAATSSPPLATTTNSVAPLPTNTVAPELPPSAPLTSPEDGCTKFNLCSSCTSAPSGSCGFCAVTKTCMNGNSQGPLHGQCGGSSWEWYASKCVNE